MATSIGTNREDPPYILPSLRALHKYGVPKSTALYMIQKHWHIHSYRHLLQTYFLLHWKKDYFLNKLRAGKIEKDNKLYSVFYYKCDPSIILRACVNSQVKLSFRELHKEYAAEPTVLVALA